jgi:hypothetical protein
MVVVLYYLVPAIVCGVVVVALAIAVRRAITSQGSSGWRPLSLDPPIGVGLKAAASM